MNEQKLPKFKVGQVLMYERQRGHALPCVVLEVTADDDGTYFYRIDRKNCLHEAMLRALNDVELGK